MPDYFTRRDVLQCAAALYGVGLARGQDAPVFSADVKVVNVLATVRNKTGSLAGNLNQDDFSLSEDGRPQSIRYFFSVGYGSFGQSRLSLRGYSGQNHNCN